MTDHTKDIDALFASLTQEVEKVAEEAGVQENSVADDASLEKLAAEAYAAGEIMAAGFINAALEKLAGSGVPAAGGGSEDPIARPRSSWETVAARIAEMHGRRLQPSDDTSVRADAAGYKGHGSMSHRSGATGIVNPAKALG